ncbi:DNA (cytosine-5-)-methyltransferase [Glycomyces sp. A-F 0318]|uniref:DNA cytosine methyltransferase n=1 Tax=Glycomyces amatae TaxID=2881355 RepID=UPI001E40C382|nr:DNA (cytosine-5-)-methyltransferase [Glycomyces amatae]
MAEHVRPRLGSLFTGVGGLDLAARDVFGADLAWCADADRHASTLLAYRHPRVPNFGDITAIDWTQVPRVDVLVAGFPCQPFSTLGRRGGTSDERWLIDHLTDAIDATGPGLVLFENVPGLLKHADAFTAVIDRLSERGYVGAWRCVAAADAGAPHLRMRVFIAAVRPERAGLLAPAHADTGRHPGDPAHARSSGGLDSGPVAAPVELPRHDDRPAARWCWGGYQSAVTRWETVTGRSCPHPVQWRAGWGRGPERTEPRTEFLEWAMGLPPGWVTDVPRLTWLQQHKLIGNSVVPQQAALAYRALAGDLLAVLDESSLAGAAGP